jgi:hypothetical protein
LVSLNGTGPSDLVTIAYANRPGDLAIPTDWIGMKEAKDWKKAVPVDPALAGKG